MLLLLLQTLNAEFTEAENNDGAICICNATSDVLICLLHFATPRTSKTCTSKADKTCTFSLSSREPITSGTPGQKAFARRPAAPGLRAMRWPSGDETRQPAAPAKRGPAHE